MDYNNSRVTYYGNISSAWPGRSGGQKDKQNDYREYIIVPLKISVLLTLSST